VSVYRLIIELLGKDKGATRSLKAVKKEVGGLERASMSLQGAMTAAAGFAGMAYMGKQAFDLAADLWHLTNWPEAQVVRQMPSFRPSRGPAAAQYPKWTP
jgi:hypothetical protein